VITRPIASKGYRWLKKRDMRASIKGGDNNYSVLLKSNSNYNPTYYIRKITN
jgi:hypothetical protein